MTILRKPSRSIPIGLGNESNGKTRRIQDKTIFPPGESKTTAQAE